MNLYHEYSNSFGNDQFADIHNVLPDTNNVKCQNAGNDVEQGCKFNKYENKLWYYNDVHKSSECTSQAGGWADDTCPIGVNDTNSDCHTPVANNNNGASAHISNNTGVSCNRSVVNNDVNNFTPYYSNVAPGSNNVTRCEKFNVNPLNSWVHGSSAFQMVSDAVTYIMAKRHHKVLAYIDDYIIISHKDTALTAFDDLYQLLQELGLPISAEKHNPPCKSLTCLGIGVNLHDNNLSIDHSKLEEIYLECQKFHTKKQVSRRSFQSLLGKLLYIHKCVSPARVFINRMLSVFRDSHPNNRINLTSQFFRDLEWFINFLPQFNGVTFISETVIPHDHTLHIDASLTGLSGIWSNRVYATPLSPCSTSP